MPELESVAPADVFVAAFSSVLVAVLLVEVPFRPPVIVTASRVIWSWPRVVVSLARLVEPFVGVTSVQTAVVVPLVEQITWPYLLLLRNSHISDVF